jgi:hypothetical protein
MKKAVGTILKVLAVLAVFAAIAAIVIYDTPGFDEIIKGRIVKQLKTSYGQSFRCYALSDRNPIVPNFAEELNFSCIAEDGTYMAGTCDWKGTIQYENFVHYYYSDAMDKEIEDIIDGCFDEFLVIEDIGTLNEKLSLEKYPMRYGSVTNADEYLDDVTRFNTSFRVYVRAGVKNSELQSALDKLSASRYKGNVYFVEVKDTWFDALKESGITCNTKHTDAVITLNGASGNEQMDFNDMLESPSRYFRGEYLPGSGTAWVTGYPKDSPDF